jgi:hypothetical protein
VRLNDVPRELLCVLLAIEALFFQYEGGHAIIEQGNAAVMGLRHDAKNLQGQPPVGAPARFSD